MSLAAIPSRNKDIPPVFRLGASGWSCPDRRERFCPAGLVSRDWLEFFSRQFDNDYRAQTVENRRKLRELWA